ncbi:MAG: hypothetical protein HGA53_01510 [Anaerolineaceae bacterium]|nr:hypothetical protein [Anaerolineaceae bacterium]
MGVDLIWTLIGFLLTLLVFSYLFGDNPLFRLVSYIFVGVVAGYVFVLVTYQIMIPHLITPLLESSGTDQLLAFVPLLLSGLMLTKLSPKFSRLGNLPMAYLVGAGAAIIVGGAVTGTLIRQVGATINLFDLGGSTAPAVKILEGVLTIAGVVSTLAYFQFSAKINPDKTIRRHPVVEILAVVGQVFIGITLGALFSGVFSAALTALIERMDFLRNVITGLF